MTRRPPANIVVPGSDAGQPLSVTLSDPLTFVVVPIVAALTAAAACVAPAWRATRVDPATAFRDEW